MQAKNTKIQISEDLSNVPKLCTSIVEQKVRRELEMISCEVEHLLRTSKHDGVAQPENIIWHIDQARRRLFWLDSYMGDVYTIASQYLEYTKSSGELQAAAEAAVHQAAASAGVDSGGFDEEAEAEK